MNEENNQVINQNEGNETAPVVEMSAPVAEPAPVVEAPVPVAEPAPVVEAPAPVVEPTPVVEAPAPAVEPAPVVEAPTPVVEPTPVVVAPTPVAEPTPMVQATPVTTNQVEPQPVNMVNNVVNGNAQQSSNKKAKMIILIATGVLIVGMIIAAMVMKNM